MNMNNTDNHYTMHLHLLIYRFMLFCSSFHLFILLNGWICLRGVLD